MLTPVGVWIILSSSVADHPLRPATHCRLGEPLPHQLANETRAHLQAAEAFTSQHLGAGRLSGISTSFPVLCLSWRQVTHVLLTRTPLSTD